MAATFTVLRRRLAAPSSRLLVLAKKVGQKEVLVSAFFYVLFLRLALVVARFAPLGAAFLLVAV